MHPDGPFKPVLMYCDEEANRGAVISWKGRNITVRIGLECDLDKMWMKENTTCTAINNTIRTQLLDNYNFFTKDLATLPDGTLSSIYEDPQIGNIGYV